MSEYKLKTGKVGEGYQKIEDTVVGTYKKVDPDEADSNRKDKQ